jgi:UDP:flavonoid glycosyltransferase YjiC (YdhE family)
MIEVFNPDVIVIDILFMGILPLLLLDKQDRPQVISCGVIAPMWRDPGSSPFTGPDNTEAGRLKNIDDGFKFDASVLPGTAYIDRILHSLRVSVQGGFRMFDTMYTLPDQVLQFCTKDFEYPLAKSRENLLFVGPILPGSPADRNESKGIDGVDGSLPSVLVTQGTLANIDFDQLVNPTIKGLAGENLQIIVTAGGGDLSTIVRAPNTVIRRFIPYGSALRSASAFITNGGYNGVQEALSFGVPIVSAGATEDKPYVSARVAWSGAGLNLHTGNPTPNQIRDAVIRVRSEPYFRRHAVRLSDTIRQTDALAAVASIVDAVSPSQYQYH